MDEENWDDYRYFLAVAEHGTLSAAGRVLSVSQPTVSRRIAQLEQRLGTRLFNHLPNKGMTVTAAGQDIVDLVRALHETTSAVSRKITGREAELSGPVTITVTEAFATCWLAERLIRFMEMYPDIMVNCLADDRFLNLARRDADIAIRFGAPSSSSLIGTRIAHAHCGIYGASSYFEQHGIPRTLSELNQHKLIDTVEPIARFKQSQDMKKLMLDAEVACMTNSSQIQLAMADAGRGIIATTCYMTARHKNLERVLADEYDRKLEMWMLTHPDLKDCARIRVLMEFLHDEIKADSKTFKGKN